MDRKMYEHFYKAYQFLQFFLESNQKIDNPMMVRLLVVLQEQQTTLYHLLIFLYQNHKNQEDQLRYLIQVVYLSEEVANPLYRAWRRSSIWRKSATKEQLVWSNHVMKELRNELVLAVPTVESKFGIQESKYIIPPLIRSEYHYHQGGV